MAKGIVIYYSRTGNTKAMAETIAEAMNKAHLPTQGPTSSRIGQETHGLKIRSGPTAAPVDVLYDAASRPSSSKGG